MADDTIQEWEKSNHFLPQKEIIEKFHWKLKDKR